MANDGGLIAELEDWFATQLATLTYNGDDIFKTAAVWKHQVSADSGGMEAFARYAPFAFVGYDDGKAAREGGYDLRRVLSFHILIGVEYKEAGVARFGSATEPGVSIITQQVINLFDKNHPGGDLACDEIYYTDEMTVYEDPNRYMVEMVFETSKMMPQS